MRISRLKIAMVAACPFPANHGTPAAIKEMSYYLAKKGLDIHIVTYPIYEEGIEVSSLFQVHRAGTARQEKIIVGPFRERPIHDLRLIFKLIQVVKTFDIDIIHAHNYEGLLVGIVAKILCRRPLIYNAINVMKEELPSYNFIKPNFLATFLGSMLDLFFPRMANYVIADTPELEKFLIKRGVHPKKISWIPSGVDFSFFDIKKSDILQLKKKYNLENKKVIVYTGTLDKFQGIDLLLFAFQIVKREIPYVLLFLVGSTVSDEHLNFYLKKTKELGINKDVFFVRPSLKEVPLYLHIADVAVVPRANSFGIPTKLLNYLACGCPTVSFEGSAHFLKDTGAVYIVPGNNQEDLAKGIIEVLCNEDLSLQLKENAKRIVKKYYDWDKICDRIIYIYNSMIC